MSAFVFLTALIILLLAADDSFGVANLKYFETLSHVTVTSSIKRSADGTRDLLKHLMFQAFEREFHLTLKPDTHLMAPGFRARLIEADGSSSEFQLHDNLIYSGHLSDRPDVRVHAHIEDSLWCAQIFFHDNIYMLEPAWRLLTQAENPRNDTLIAYRASDLTSDSSNSSQFCDVKDHKGAKQSRHPFMQHGFFRVNHKDISISSRFRKGKSRMRLKRSINNTICKLFLIADYTFYKGKCKGNHVACSALMFGSTNFVDIIYKTSQFVVYHNKEDGSASKEIKYTGVGLQVAEIAIYKTYTVSMVHCGKRHFNNNHSWTSGQLLESFGFYLRFLAHQKRFCAHNLFTDYPLPHRILGIAWLKTLCHINSGSVSINNCAPVNDPSQTLLNSAITSGVDILAGEISSLQMNLVFAHGHIFGSEHDLSTGECSSTEEYGGNFIMWAKSVSGRYTNNLKFSPCSLKHIGLMLQQANCLVRRSEVANVCGNGALEDKEECDAGSFGLVNADMCCNVSCQLNETAICSDSNYPCCKNCQMAPANTLCLNAVPAECNKPSYCTGEGFDCPAPAMAPDGTPCPGSGHCFDGKCLSFCATESRRLGVRLQGCFCRTNDNGAACKQCCFNVDNKSDSCRVYSIKTLSDGMPCYLGNCQAGVCESVQVSTITRIYRFIPTIERTVLKKLVTDNLVMCVIAVSLLVMLPPTFLICRADEREKERLKAAAVASKQSRSRLNCQLSNKPVVKDGVPSAVLVSPQHMRESLESSELTDYGYIRTASHISGSMITFVISEASRIYSVGTYDNRLAVFDDEVDKAQSDAVDDIGKSNVVDTVETDVVDKTKSDVRDEAQSKVADDKTNNDIVNKARSATAKKAQSSAMKKKQSKVVDGKAKSNVVNKAQSDAEEKAQSTAAEDSGKSGIMDKTRRGAAGKAQSAAVNKAQSKAANHKVKK